MSVLFVESEFLTCADAVEEVGALGLGIGEFGELVHDVGDGALEAFVDFAFRTFDVGHFAGVFVAFAFEDNLTAVVVGVGNLMPDAYSVGVLLGCVDFNLDGEVVVLAEEILNRVEIVLTHVGKTAAVVVPIAAVW